jgi:Lsr2
VPRVLPKHSRSVALVDDQEAIEEIDLSEKHAAALRDAFAPFVGSARRAGGSPVASRPRMSTRAGRPREETAAIREWATANGVEVSTRGRISSTVLEAYENRGNAAVAAATVVQPAVEAKVEAKPKRRTRKKATAED